MGRKTPRRKSEARRRPPKRLPDAAAPESPYAEVRPEPSEGTTFPIVGIGASAGGLEAFSQLLKELPADTGMAFVLIQHLDPKHESRLPEVLSKTTAMPVLTVTDRLRVEPDQIYVIPSNTDMTIGGGVFALTPRAAVERHTPIDRFFRSLAQEQEGRAIGVVLSGTGSDGTLGLRAIKEKGGITFVQDEKSAKHPGMPQSAAVVADSVLPPAGIARELVMAEHLPEVFNRFGAPHTSSQSQGGMGLGLAIVRHLVELHGGAVQAESLGPGQGATFTVTLPITDERSASEAAALGIAAKGLGLSRLPALNNVRVLVVDDEADTRELLRAILAQCGAEVAVAATAREALEMLEQLRFDVLVSDIVMPDEDGYDLIRKVRARDADRGGRIPALAVTAYARIEDRTAAVAAGYQQHAAKPIEPAELAAAVAAVLGRAEGTRGDGVQHPHK
jgi:chemotaxis response regulator CheB